jgi:hypothetical protein
MVKLCLFVIALLLVFFGVFVAAVHIRPETVLVVDRESGQVIGEYQTTAYRTAEELVGAGLYFLEHFYSFNSRTVYRDFTVAINMMDQDLSKKRLAYLKDTNLAKDIHDANYTSRLENESSKILKIIDDVTRIEFDGKLIIKGKRAENEETEIPYRIVLDLKGIRVNKHNTKGVRVVDYYEYN